MRIESTSSIDSVVDNVLVGQGVRIGNVKLTGLRTSLGYFASDTSIIGMKGGLLLSTGNVDSVARANISPGTSGIAADMQQKFRPDKDLARECHCRVYDQVILEFDFVPSHNSASFRYCFASEEYNEYVGSTFNDAFVFMLTGPKVKRKNMALLPRSTARVAVNSVNLRRRPELYVNNDYFLNYGLLKNIAQRPRIFFLRRWWNNLFNKKNDSPLGFFTLPGEKKKLNQVLVNNVEYDGFTRVLTASAYVKPWQLYHLKMVLGDVGDDIFDSGVFLEQGSLRSEKDKTEPGFAEYRDLSRTMNWDSIFGQVIKPVSTTLMPPVLPTASVTFGVDEYAITSTERDRLDGFARYVVAHPGKLQIQGFTDNTGTRSHNYQLSLRRALTVMYYLTGRGIPRSQMLCLGDNGGSIMINKQDEKAQANSRRVEVSFIEE
ncbi:hypothetical protein GCM10022409_35690 [Hymenobacter glaciei]|uniref:OmpA-like domain-containing protein n=2 Tax=Hymenobacter glaciei TaxID=877209 RepID=A0ABP7ULD1_9BACT